MAHYEKGASRPLRTCVACRGLERKQDLLRFIRQEKGVLWDSEQRSDGRGVYLHRSENCLSAGLSIGLWARAFRVNGASFDNSQIRECVAGVMKEVLGQNAGRKQAVARRKLRL